MSHLHSTALRGTAASRRTLGNHPMAWAIAVALGSMAVPAGAQQAFSPAWFADKGAAHNAAAQSGRMPNGAPVNFGQPTQQQDAARQKLQQSIDNLGSAAQAIALQQRMQEQARQNLRNAGYIVADGLGKGGLKVDENPLTRGWINARDAVQKTGADGKVEVSIEQTADKAILNWETFNVGANTVLSFGQNADWAVLNRVNDPNARPSQILGQIKAPGSVFIANRNGVVFGNNSQINVRNLVAAAARISDAQFNDNGLFGADATMASLTDAAGDVLVERGARITTHVPGTATRSGGYVLLAGQNVENAGQIETVKGQAQLAAGDSFIIRRGVGTAQNTASTTRGNEIAPQLAAGSTAGTVTNSGLIQAREGDITLAGRTVEQAGVAVATTTVNQRGTVHLLNSLADRTGSVTLAEGSTTAVLIEDDGKTTALDSQRDALIAESSAQNIVRATSNTGTFDNLSRMQDRRDQSRIEIVSGGNVAFEGQSLTLATGGQVVVDAAGRSALADGARVDVSGAVGVKVSMESNNVKINVQGNELRDSPDNRDSGKLNSLNNNEAWIDRRQLIHVAAGTGGYEAERWYAAGGLLEVGGYLGTQGHSVSEWAAQGGSVLLGGNEVITQAGSRINLAGGSLDVASGTIQQTWLRGTDGQLYRLDDAPAAMLFAGLYRGFESSHERWGVTENFRNPLIASERRVENGYTVGRDAGQLVISAPTAVLDGDIDTRTFQGVRQDRGPDAGKDGYTQAQTAVARNAALLLGQYGARGREGGFATDVRLGDTVGLPALADLQAPLDTSRGNTFWMDADTLSAQQWGSLDLLTRGTLHTEGSLRLQDGAALVFTAAVVQIDGDITAHGGSLSASNLQTLPNGNLQAILLEGRGSVGLGDGARIDLSGTWTNRLMQPERDSQAAWVNGGQLDLQNSHDVQMGAGSEVIVDAGGRVDVQGDIMVGNAGSVALRADVADVPSDGSGRVHLGDGARFSALGLNRSGAFLLETGGQVQIGGAPVDDALTLETSMFASGFSSYDINGHAGVVVPEGVQLHVLRPSVRPTTGALSAVDHKAALETWQAPLYQVDPGSGAVTRREGADLTLRSERLFAGGSVSVGEGALVEVDSGNGILLRAAENITVDGTLRARSGRIALEGVRYTPGAYPSMPGTRTWRLGDTAVLDASADSFVAVDASGRRQGIVNAGGRITLGGDLDWETRNAVADSVDAFVVVDAGARLLASGTSERLDVQGQGVQQVDTDGGRIVIRSANALYLQGALEAAAGGVSAEGGTLGVAFGGSVYGPTAVDAVLVPRELALGQDREQGLNNDAPVYGHGYLSLEQIAQGGFDHLSLFGDVRTDGALSLAMDGSLRLLGSIGFRPSAAAGTLALSAPYLSFAQGNWRTVTGENMKRPAPPTLAQGAGNQLTASAELIDVRDAVSFTGFDKVDLRSTGDLRLLRGNNVVGSGFTQLAAPSALDITAAQIYPTTGTYAAIAVGLAPEQIGQEVEVWQNADALLRIFRSDGDTPAPAPSVFGSISLVGANVEQGGVVRAPLGKVLIGGVSNQAEGAQVRLLDGSITSTSAAGLSLPYGGTVDGLQWYLDGTAVEPQEVGGRIAGTNPIGITFKARQTKVDFGALLDMSGGGELTGAAYVSGRGGSVDILRNALADANPAYAFSASGNPVYAILPGYGGSVAPAGLSQGSADPALGQRIVVPEGVPGLAAGTYTLLPASFALQPGAFRVELGSTGVNGVAGAIATGTGSWRVAGRQGRGLGTDISPLLTDMLITPAAMVRRHSGYDETSYNTFVARDAERRGLPRGLQTVDAGRLKLDLSPDASRDGTSALKVAGQTRLGAAAGSAGFAGSVVVSTTGGPLDIIAAATSAPEGHGAVLEAEALNALAPARMVLGGDFDVGAYTSPTAVVNALAPTVRVHDGAALYAPEIILTAKQGGAGIVVEQGATLSTLGQGAASYDASDGFFYQGQNGAAVFAVSNGDINLLPNGSVADVDINIGACLKTTCAGQALVVSEGSITAATEGRLQIGENASYGTRRLGLAVSAINLGQADAIAAFAANGGLPAGLTLNQDMLQNLLKGNTAIQAPALETLSLSARDAINVIGSVELDTRDAVTGKSQLKQLMLGAPAIHGYGNADDRARIVADTLLWDGAMASPQAAIGSGATTPQGAAMVDRLGAGRLDIVASTLELGSPASTRRNSESSANRQLLGFSSVNLQASDRVLFSGKGTLDVYQQQGDYVAGQGWTYTGGELDITTPLFTGADAAKLAVRTGGMLTMHGNGSAAGDNAALGAELSLQARDIVLDSTLKLASGRLSAKADGGITLGGNADLDLAGRTVTLLDVDKYSWGGDIELSAASGDILADAGSRIDVSARNNRGGRLTVNASGAGAGRVSLAGTLLGGASGTTDAGGSLVPWDGGELVLHARQLEDFQGLNQRLTAGGITGARTFQLDEGDLVIGDEVKARKVDISVDGGSLQVNGRVDASGVQVGSIRLAARDLLQVNGTLDAHGTGLRVDSYGKIIDSPNRADIELTSSQGRVALGSAAQLDLRSGTDLAVGTAAGQNDGAPRGMLRLNVPRVGSNDAGIDVASGVSIDGAREIQLNGFRRYSDAPLASADDVHGNRPQLVTQTWLDEVVDPDNRAWFDAAFANTDLQQRVAALGSYRLRPGVEIVAYAGGANSRGDLVMSGDIDLSGYRYGPQADRNDPSRRGFGESGSLVLRAEGDINLYGSINDGFAPPPSNPDEGGWLLMPGASGDARTPYGADIIVPIGGVRLQANTRFSAGTTLNYAIPFRAMTLPAGTEVPMPTRIAGTLQLATGTVLRASVTTADGQVLAAGTVLSAPLSLGPGSTLGAGFRLDSALAVQAQQWPAGVPLPADMRLSTAVELKAGSLIPSMTEIVLAGNTPVNLRPADANGNQGRNWALAAMLPEGTTSWDITVVAGADTEAADMRTRRFGATGNLILSDTHYSTIRTVETTSVFIGTRVVTLQGSLEIWGDDSWVGKPVSELAEAIGYTEDELCALGDAYCEIGGRLLTREGSLNLWGDESFADRPVRELAEMIGYTEDELCALDPTFCYGGGEWVEETLYASRPGSPAWSVLRTGTGDLNLLAAGDVAMRSGFGVYTAGTPTSLGADLDVAFDPARAPLPGLSSLLGPVQAGGAYDAVLAAYRAWYPDAGGNLLVAAGADILGDTWAESASLDGFSDSVYADAASSSVGNWLWRQGSGTTAGVDPASTSWWINFGTYVRARSSSSDTPRMVGFTGFGTLGGGNLSLEAGGTAGVREAKGGALTSTSFAGHSTAINAVVGSTGRVHDGELVLTGGGDLHVRSAGAFNPNLQATSQINNNNFQNLELNGTLVNLRGQLVLQASRVGGIATNASSYQKLDNTIPSDPFIAQRGEAMGGPVLVLGDANALLQARGDAVLGAVTDPGRAAVVNYNAVATADGSTAAGTSWFSLWTDNTALDLVSAGGDLTPTLMGTRHEMGRDLRAENFVSSVSYWMLPSKIRLLAAGGSIKLDKASDQTNHVLMTRPSANGELQVLAADSILATPGAMAISSSGSDARLPTPFEPAFVASKDARQVAGNVSVEAPSFEGQRGLPLFTFGAPTLQSTDLRANGSAPNRFYAAQGDIIGLRTGQQWELQRISGDKRTVFTYNDVAAPVHVRAGRDILLSDIGGLNNTDTDISIVEAGRDIVHTPIRIAGPGDLEVSAGRQIRQEDRASITTTGGLVQGDTRPGASISVTAGNEQLDFAALRDRYLDPNNLADPERTLAEQPGKAVKLYGTELETWLQDRFGVPAKGDAALALFDSLPEAQQRIFLRQVYHAELRAGGREYNDPDSPRFGSYLRGREAIATLLPEKDANGATIDRTGDIVMFGGSGVRTQAGGNIEMMAPGGQIVVGAQGVVPPASAGVVTQGQGDIRMFSDGSLLLGLSRVMTTFGGDIQAWSARGDINAGRGALTSVQYTPALRVYDQWGNVNLSPQAPATGAGIATLAPIAEVPAGDVDLIAPLGTIDAGEAGIRVSGNVNLAALQVLNAANVQVQGESTGLPVLATVNVNALSSASAAANSASQAAQDVMRKTQDDARKNRPSEISVQVLGFGASSSVEPKPKASEPVSSYDPNSAFQFPQAEETVRR
ncbi:filamentous hemagglutinin family protein [Stenotrophomonas sp. PS02289]|uniref:filamentous hemagglutinin family protein n=1 Tax=Stenotrophomonas sp. PS02289 TaxID=2991422 RepID=UPI00249C7B02|nr:filamentous hemagglutinin family protein [Stenotrophomonas sp. PS02289]